MIQKRPCAPDAALSPEVVAVLLGGWSAKPADGGRRDADDLFDLFQANDRGVIALWQTHEAFLRAEAARLHVAPAWPHHGRMYYFGEYVTRTTRSDRR